MPYNNEVIMEPAVYDLNTISDIANETVDNENLSYDAHGDESNIPAALTTAKAREMINKLKAKFIAAYREVPDSF